MDDEWKCADVLWGFLGKISADSHERRELGPYAGMKVGMQDQEGSSIANQLPDSKCHITFASFAAKHCLV